MEPVHLYSAKRKEKKKFGFHWFTRKSTLIILFIFSLILNILLTSCEHDEYHLNRHTEVDYGTINKSTGDYRIILDNGTILSPTSADIPILRFRDSLRVIVDYTLLNKADSSQSFDYVARINDMGEILTKNILAHKPEILDSLGNDPIMLNRCWITEDHINFDFFFGGGKLQHMVNLIHHPEKTADGRIVLEFRHNRFNDPYDYRYKSIVAFRLNTLPTNDRDSIPLQIRYRDYDHDRTVEMVYLKK